MAQIGNTPLQHTVLRVEARKSFSFGLWIIDSYGRPVDLSGCELTLVAKEPPIDTTSDATNLVGPDAQANIVVPDGGYAKFSLQALTLDHPPGEYPFVVVLRTPEGYTSVIVKGTLDIQENPEVASVSSTFSSMNPPQSLIAHLQERNIITVEVGGQPPPGMHWLPTDLLERLNAFDPESIALVPPGGRASYVLVKTSASDYSMAWRPPSNGPGGLDAEGIPHGFVPVSAGDDTWTWGASGIDATSIPAGWVPQSNGDDSWSWAEQELVAPTPDWAATPGSEGEILNKPMLGSAAAEDTSAFLAADTLLSQLEGVHFVTTPPTSGTDGHLYFVYTP